MLGDPRGLPEEDGTGQIEPCIIRHAVRLSSVKTKGHVIVTKLLLAKTQLTSTAQDPTCSQRMFDGRFSNSCLHQCCTNSCMASPPWLPDSILLLNKR